jgi:uncharacterized small protein (DUF1192 family)
LSCVVALWERIVANAFDSEKEELDLQLRSVPDIEKRIAELTAA